MTWSCLVCGGTDGVVRWKVGGGTENGVSAAAFRPSTDRYGETVGTVLHCSVCGHGSLAERPSAQAVAQAYDDATDPETLAEEPGQVETARRVIAWIESAVPPGRFADLGCWTGSSLVAAAERGWDPIGLEPSAWAVQRAAERGLAVVRGSLDDDLDALGLHAGSFDAVLLGDVIEHLLDPAAGLAVARRLLRPGGVLVVLTPDAGSALARLLRGRWWSVLPMHVQYFTRESLRRLLVFSGFDVAGVRTHPKVFTASYYADRLAGYAPPLAGAVRALTGRAGSRLVAPDFHDRMAVLAVAR